MQSYITELPREVLSTPFGQLIAPGLRNMQGTLNNVQQPPTPAKPTPFSIRSPDVTAAVTDSLRCAKPPNAKVWKYLVYLKYLKYWTLSLIPLMVYPKILFHPNFSVKGQTC